MRPKDDGTPEQFFHLAGSDLSKPPTVQDLLAMIWHQLGLCSCQYRSIERVITLPTPRDQLDDLYSFRRVALASVVGREEIGMSVPTRPIL